MGALAAGEANVKAGYIMVSRHDGIAGAAVRLVCLSLECGGAVLLILAQCSLIFRLGLREELATGCTIVERMSSSSMLLRLYFGKVHK